MPDNSKLALGLGIVGPSGKLRDSMAAQRIFGIRAVGGRRFRQWALFSIVLSAVLVESPLGQRMESEFGLRWLYQTRGALPSPSDVVLVTMDDASANALGTDVSVESWPRTLHACLIDHLAKMGAAVVVIDVNFESVVRHDPLPESYAAAVGTGCDLMSDEAGTRQLGASIKAAGNVLLASYLGQRQDANLQMTWERMPIPEVAAGALGIAPSPLPDRGERFRSFYTFRPAIGNDDSAGLETASLVAMAVQAFERESVHTIIAKLGLDAGDPSSVSAVAGGSAADSKRDLRQRMTAIRHQVQQSPAARAAVAAIDPRLGELYAGTATPFLNMYGLPGGLDEIPYHELLAANLSPTLAARVRGKAVFVGAAEHFTNTRLDSYLTDYPTPPGQKYGGVELVAIAFANLREGRTLKLLYAWQEVMLLGLLGGLLAAASWRWDPLRVLPAAVAASLAYLACAHSLFARNGLWLPQIVPVMVEIPLLMIGSTLDDRQHAAAISAFAESVAGSGRCCCCL